MRRGLLVLAFVAGALRASIAHADSDQDRYERSERVLEATSGPSAVWWNGWALGFGVCSVAQGAVALAARDRGLRVDSAVGAASCGLGFAGVLLEPRTAIGASAELRAMDASNPRARRARRLRAEALVAQVAREQREGRSWVPHVLGGAVNLAGSAVLWLGYQRYLSGWLNLLGGTLVTELQIATRPTAAMVGERELHSGAYRFWLAPAPDGLTVGGGF
ncbi:MAG: hypothetical protein U0263_34320 [Polyangiaceae bacterium]